jgi:DNA-binding LacI/PurR family transcriptional regulator
MKRLGLEPRYVDALVSAQYDVERLSYEKASAVLRNGSFPSRTLLCASDRVAFGVMAALNEAGMRIGTGADCQFRVAGHDNQRMSAFTAPPLTTVTQNIERIGELALDILLAKMGQDKAPAEGDRVLLSGELVVRKSA